MEVGVRDILVLFVLVLAFVNIRHRVKAAQLKRRLKSKIDA